MIKMPRLHFRNTALFFTLAAITVALSACGGSVRPDSPATAVTTGGAPPAGTPAPGTATSPSSSGPPPTISFGAIEDMSGWLSCANRMNGKECAGGNGFAPTSLVQHQAQPSLSGSSAHFWLGGKTPYSNVMWWRNLADGNPQAKTYRYEFDVYMKNPGAPEALEFDVNQSATGIRWVMGTECNFKGTHHWDVWDANAHWVPTPAPCNTFAANAWTHVAWNFERLDGQVHYVSVEVNGVTYPVNMTMRAEKNWPWDGSLNIAFQMDGDVSQTNFDTWLDNMTLKGW